MSYTDDLYGSLYKSFAPGELEAMLAQPSPNVAFDNRRQPEVRADGLVEHVRLDDANRKIKEFTLAPGRNKRTGWMRPYMPETVGVQVRLNTQPKADALAAALEAERVEARWLEFQNTAAKMQGGRS